MESMTIQPITRQDWVGSLSGLKEDSFSKTFLGKADSRNLWGQALGIFVDGQVAGGLVFTYSKRQPKAVNIQLLHTFHKHRHKGIGKKLIEECLSQSFEDNCIYFRLASSPMAKPFYEKCGLKFWGRQKSGGYLCIGRFTSPNTFVFDIDDPYINERVFHRQGKIVGPLENISYI